MPNALDQISNIVVLMLENGSFDRMLGFLQSDDYPIAGLTSTDTVPLDPADPHGPVVQVSTGVSYRGSFDTVPNDDRTAIDPAHDVASVHEQLFRGSPDGEPANQGFIWSYQHQPGNTPEHAKSIIQCFAPEQLPVLTTLAREFAICDHWFSSVPGPTWPNRLFVHAGTSAGHVDNGFHPDDYDIPTIYDRLDDAGVTWKLYFHDIPQALALPHLQADVARDRIRLFSEFLEDAHDGILPAYAFIEPRYLDFLFLKANDQHPPHDLALGEYLIADVYEALRRSPHWEHCLLVILSDEHGGLYDHVPPPRTGSPDGKVSADPPFDFTRLGVRVPAVLVSPYIPKGTIDHHVYDHTSVLATLERRYNLQPLTGRDAAANSFEANLSLETARTDPPETLPRPADPLTARAYADSQFKMTELSADRTKDELRAQAFAIAPISDFQVGLVKLTKNLVIPGEEAVAAALRCSQWADIEHDVAQLIQQFTTQFFGGLFH